MGLPFESLENFAPAPTTRYRAMACARQLYIFSIADDRAQADILFSSLLTRFKDNIYGGFFYSIDAQGIPLEKQKDLYTHAFVIFACSVYFERFGVVEARHVVTQTFLIVQSRFPLDRTCGLTAAAVDTDFGTIQLPARQNPLMHLAEAYLAARALPEKNLFDDALASLLPLFSDTFLHRSTGCIAELPIQDDNNWTEPGHQFEWLYLSESTKHFAFEHSGLRSSLLRAFNFAQGHGVDASTGGVTATLSLDGAILDDTQRIWAQTEYLRALTIHPDAMQRAKLSEQVRHFVDRHLHASGWRECIAPDGGVLREDMPSTTPYHLATAYSALLEAM